MSGKFPMKLAIDFRMSESSGIGTCLREIVSNLPSIDAKFCENVALLGGKSMGGFTTLPFNSKIYSLSEQFSYLKYFNKFRAWHAPHYNIPLAKPASMKLITTVHDLTHWIFGEHFGILKKMYAGFFFKRVVALSDHIIAVSENTKQDLIRCFSADPQRISVIYNGVNDLYKPAQTELEKKAIAGLREKYQLPERFFLYVGLMKPHKNIMFLLKNYTQMVAQNKTKMGLVLVGKTDQNSLEEKHLKTHPTIKHFSHIEWNELPGFYQAADCLIHPSLYEGFGLTVLESMASGTPVITTRGGSLPEVCDNVATYISGQDSQELQLAMDKIQSQPGLKFEMQEKLIRQAAKFKWSHAAQQTLQVYKQVLGACE